MVRTKWSASHYWFWSYGYHFLQTKTYVFNKSNAHWQTTEHHRSYRGCFQTKLAGIHLFINQHGISSCRIRIIRHCVKQQSRFDIAYHRLIPYSTGSKFLTKRRRQNRNNEYIIQSAGKFRLAHQCCCIQTQKRLWHRAKKTRFNHRAMANPDVFMGRRRRNPTRNRLKI